MIPKTKKLFISYRSSDAAKVDKIARDLTLLKHNDGTPRYRAWQDKHNLPPASPHWWDAIVDAIIDCDMFVFNISRASLQSEVCRSELDYAHKRNRPIIPVVLDGEFFLDPESGKYNIKYWDLVPEWLGERQFLFCVGAEFYSRFEESVTVFEREWPPDIPAPRPLNPDDKGTYKTSHAVYDAACDYAQRLAFAEAEKHFASLVRRNDRRYKGVSVEWIELLRRYAELIEIDERPNNRFLFKEEWKDYLTLFPKSFLDDIFDPKDFKSRITNTGGTPSPAPTPVSPPKIEVPTVIPIHKRSIDIMPKPFDWIAIHGYSIAKYPVTNEQYGFFVEANGYLTQKWWTEAGWEAREKGWGWVGNDFKETGKAWTEPRYWQDAKLNGAHQPVVGVSWHEAVAFCLWLSDVTGENVMLPTEDQWQYAAQGNNRKIYPWGNEWDYNRCNNSVNPCSSSGTALVTEYEGKGDSPFGVVDMVGNVWEWCLTDYSTKINHINSIANRPILRGGSWVNAFPEIFRADYQHRDLPHTRNNVIGYRIALF